MSNRQPGFNERWDSSELSALQTPQDLLKEDIRLQRKRRDLAFMNITLLAGYLGIAEPGSAIRCSYPAGEFCERSVIAGSIRGRYKEPVLRVYVNDKTFHPDPARPKARQLMMTTYAASTLGKRLVCCSSLAEKEHAGAKWRTEGGFVGPLIVHDKELETVYLCGNDKYVAPTLPHPMESSPPNATQARMDNAALLIAVLNELSPLHFDPAEADIFIPQSLALEI